MVSLIYERDIQQQIPIRQFHGPILFITATVIIIARQCSPQKQLRTLFFAFKCSAKIKRWKIAILSRAACVCALCRYGLNAFRFTIRSRVFLLSLLLLLFSCAAAVYNKRSQETVRNYYITRRRRVRTPFLHVVWSRDVARIPQKSAGEKRLRQCISAAAARKQIA